MDDDPGETPLKGSARGGTENGADPPGALQEEEASQETESPKQVTETSLERTQGDPGPTDVVQADSAAPEAPPEESELHTTVSHVSMNVAGIHSKVPASGAWDVTEKGTGGLKWARRLWCDLALKAALITSRTAVYNRVTIHGMIIG